MSILVTTTNTGTPRASARPRCSGEEGGGGGREGGWLRVNGAFLLEGGYDWSGSIPHTRMHTHTHTHTYTHTFSHSNHPSVGSHHHHAEVWCMSSHAKYGSLEVPLVTGKVYEGDHLGGGTAYLSPVEATYSSMWGGQGGVEGRGDGGDGEERVEEMGRRGWRWGGEGGDGEERAEMGRRVRRG